MTNCLPNGLTALLFVLQGHCTYNDSQSRLLKPSSSVVSLGHSETVILRLGSFKDMAVSNFQARTKALYKMEELSTQFPFCLCPRIDVF